MFSNFIKWISNKLTVKSEVDSQLIEELDAPRIDAPRLDCLVESLQSIN